jgi:hypothetical protein
LKENYTLFPWKSMGLLCLPVYVQWFADGIVL